jgi:integrase
MPCKLLEVETKSRSIPLNDSALWVLEQLTSKGKSEYLFPSPVTGKPYTTITRAWYRLRKKAKIPNYPPVTIPAAWLCQSLAGVRMAGRFTRSSRCSGT